MEQHLHSVNILLFLLSYSIDKEVVLVDVHLYTRRATIEVEERLSTMLSVDESSTNKDPRCRKLLTCIILGSPFL